MTAAVVADGAPAEPVTDPYPYDTDNDGTDNAGDPDDDGDGADDGRDNCRIDTNATQADLDADGLGDACDVDRDGDDELNAMELTLGSDPDDPTSRPEYVGGDGGCANGIDYDRDGAVDRADPGCADGDGDGSADGDDLCPTVPDAGGVDRDGDGLGDACHLRARIGYVERDLLGAADTETDVVWTASAAGTYTVRVGGTDCTSGAVVDSGVYDRGTGEAPVASLTIVTCTALAEGANVVRLCVTAGGEEASDEVPVDVDTRAGAPAVELAPGSDTGTPGDGVTTSRSLELRGTTEPLAAVTVRQDGAVVGRVVADEGGAWAMSDPGPLADGAYAYTAETVDVAGNEAGPGLALIVTVQSEAGFAFRGFFSPVDNLRSRTRSASGRPSPSGSAWAATGGSMSSRPDRHRPGESNAPAGRRSTRSRRR